MFQIVLNSVDEHFLLHLLTAHLLCTPWLLAALLAAPPHIGFSWDLQSDVLAGFNGLCVWKGQGLGVQASVYGCSIPPSCLSGLYLSLSLLDLVQGYMPKEQCHSLLQLSSESKPLHSSPLS